VVGGVGGVGGVGVASAGAEVCGVVSVEGAVAVVVGSGIVCRLVGWKLFWNEVAPWVGVGTTKDFFAGQVFQSIERPEEPGTVR
jgi:hypothetical protein